MNSSSKVTLIIFLPVIAAYILPALFLLPVGVTFTLIAIADPTLPFSSAASFDKWIIGPIVAAMIVFYLGRMLVSFYQRGFFPRPMLIAIWGLFTTTLFAALWFGVSILTSIGATETPLPIFLRKTACGAAGLTLFAQFLVIPWLVFIYQKVFSGDKRK